MFTGLIQALALLRLPAGQSQPQVNDSVGGRSGWANGCSMFINRNETWSQGDAPTKDQRNNDAIAFWSNVCVGDSIAVAGCCLTVHAIDEIRVEFRLSAETLRCTHLGELDGQVANLEKALTWGAAIGGHIVSGHVESLGSLARIEKAALKSAEATEADLWFQVPTDKAPLLRFKDSITVDGVSLTIAEIDVAQAQFRVSLIAQTLARTTLRLLKPGDAINLEFNNHALMPAALSDALQASTPASLAASLPVVAQVPEVRDDAYFMRVALAEAEKGRGTTAPNPWVGCVLVHDGVIIARGHHVKAGEPHAEVNALREAAAQGVSPVTLRACTAYVTLEPCHKFGRQPPCDRALIDAGVKRVVVALLDPDDRTNGQGVGALRGTGIQVTTGVLEAEARASLKPYLHQRSAGRPFVVSKLATTLDGRYCLASGAPARWITNAASRQHGHATRAASQAILIGSSTVLTDNPRLNVRGVGDSATSGAQPLRVVIDSRGVVTDTSLAVLDVTIGPTLVFTTDQAAASTLALWKERGVQVVVQTGAGRVDLGAALRTLANDYGVLQVLVEGGAVLHDALLTAHLVDQFHLYTSATVLGSRGRVWAQHLRLPLATEASRDNAMSQALVSWTPVETRVLGDTDVLRIFDIGSTPTADSTFVAIAETDDAKPVFSDIHDALARFASGGLVVVMDDCTREDEGDLMVRADLVTNEQLAFMRRYTSGIICASMLPERAAALGLSHLVGSGDDPFRTPFAMSVDAATSTTGVSSLDRLATARALADPTAGPASLRRPGHFYPLIARPGVLTERQGHTEAGVELGRLVGMTTPVCVLSELTNEDGSMMRYKHSLAFAREFDLPIIHIQQLADEAERRRQVAAGSPVTSAPPTVAPKSALAASTPVIASNPVSTPIELAHCRLHLPNSPDWEFGTFSSAKLGALDAAVTPMRVLARGLHLFSGGVSSIAARQSRILVRIHSDCFTGDVLGSLMCDCGEQLKRTIALIAENPAGGMILFPSGQEGRGIGLTNKVRAYELMQRQGSKVDTYEANQVLGFRPDQREYLEAAALLKSFGLGTDRTPLTLLTTNPDKIRAMREAGLTQVDTSAVECAPSAHNGKYLQAKALRHANPDQSSIPSEPTHPQKATPTTASSSAHHQGLSHQGSPMPSATGSPSPSASPPTGDSGKHVHPGTFFVPKDSSLPAHVLQQRLCVVQACWHRDVSDQFLRLLKGELLAIGLDLPIDVYETAGCFELPYVMNELMTTDREQATASSTPHGRYAAFLGVGALIKGESMHFEYISSAVIPALMDLQLKHRVPIINGVLNCLTESQMHDRFEGRTDMPKSIAGTILDALKTKRPRTL